MLVHRGGSVRPSLVVINDPQTDESARSLSQCATREGILAGAILGLAGPGKKISGIMPCTVISLGEMADNILNRDKHPEWNGERTNVPRWSLRSPPTRSCGSVTPSCGRRVSANRATSGWLPKSTASTARRWTPGPRWRGPSGSTTTSCRRFSTP